MVSRLENSWIETYWKSQNDHNQQSPKSNRESIYSGGNRSNLRNGSENPELNHHLGLCIRRIHVWLVQGKAFAKSDSLKALRSTEVTSFERILSRKTSWGNWNSLRMGHRPTRHHFIDSKVPRNYARKRILHGPKSYSLLPGWYRPITVLLFGLVSGKIRTS